MNDVQGFEEPSEVVMALAEAWAAGDAERYAAVFTDDADYVAFDGTRMVGRQQIADGHRALFAGIMRGSRMIHRDPTARYAGPDVAVVCTLGGIVMRWQRAEASPAAKRLSTVTYVLVREHQWRATAFQNTRYRPWTETILGRVMTSLSGPS